MEDHTCFTLQHRISGVISCSVQLLCVPWFPKLCSFLCTTSSKHLTKMTYFAWCWYLQHHSAVFFQMFVIISCDIMDLKNFQLLNPEFRCPICTGITLFCTVLNLNCIALTQSESSNFFHVYYYEDNNHYCYYHNYYQYHHVSSYNVFSHVVEYTRSFLVLFQVFGIPVSIAFRTFIECMATRVLVFKAFFCSSRSLDGISCYISLNFLLFLPLI